MIKYGNFVVVLDACILYQANIRDLLLRLAEFPAELYQPRWSHEIVEEAVRNLISNGRMTQDKAVYFKTKLFNAFEEAYVENYEELIPVLKNHEKDRHVLAAAIVSGAQVIVTCNMRHYPSDALEVYNIEAQTPDIFLQNLLHLSPAVVIGTFKQLQEDLRSPHYTEQELLNKFRTVVPEFTNQLEEILSSLESEVESMLNLEIGEFLSQDR